MFFINDDEPNKSMDVRAKQRFSYQRRPLNFKLCGGGFAPRHLSRSMASLKIEACFTNNRRLNFIL